MPPTGRSAEPYAKPTREKLLAAGLDAFGERGFDGVTAREIERIAGVERGLMNYHFGSKLALWTEVVDSLFDRFDQEVTALKQALSTVLRAERVGALIVAYVRFNARFPQFFRILVLEGNRETDRSRLVLRHMKRSTDLWRAAAGVSGPPSEDQMIEAFQVFGSTGTIFATMYFSEQLYGLRTDDPGFIDRFAALVSTMLMGHHANPLPLQMHERVAGEVV